MNSLIDMMRQVKSLQNGVGIQSLLDEAYRILGNPIVMFNTEYKLLSYSDAVTDDPIMNELVKHGTFSAKTQELFKKEGFIEAVANSKRITFMISNELKYDRILGKIFNKNNTHVANIVIVSCYKPFEPCDSVVFEAVCQLITKEVSHSEFYKVYEEIYHETLIKNLIDGNFDDRELYAAHVAIIYDTLKPNLYLTVVDVSQCDPDYTKLAYFRDLFKQVQSKYKYAIYSNRILIVISTDNRNLNLNEELHELIKLFEHNNMYAGISSRFENLFELQKYYMEALKALEYIMESKSTQRIFPYDTNSINTMEQIRSLKNGMGVQYLLNQAFKILGNPVLLQDMEFKLLACTENVKVDDPVWEEFVTYGLLGDEMIAFFHNEGFFDSVVNTQTTTILTSDKLKHDRIVGKIFNEDNIMVGCLIIVASNKPFEEDEVALFGAFCEKVSREAGESEFYNNYGQAYSEALICKLIDGDINDYALFSQDIINIFDNLNDNLYLVVIDKTQCDSEHTKLGYFRELFKQIPGANRYAIYSNYILVIFSTDNTSFNVEKELNKINRLFEQNNIYAGISCRFGNVYELQKYYAEAVHALNNGLKNKSSHDHQRIFQYDKFNQISNKSV